MSGLICLPECNPLVFIDTNLGNPNSDVYTNPENHQNITIEMIDRGAQLIKDISELPKITTTPEVIYEFYNFLVVSRKSINYFARKLRKSKQRAIKKQNKRRLEEIEFFEQVKRRASASFRCLELLVSDLEKKKVQVPKTPLYETAVKIRSEIGCSGVDADLAYTAVISSFNQPTAIITQNYKHVIQMVRHLLPYAHCNGIQANLIYSSYYESGNNQLSFDAISPGFCKKPSDKSSIMV
jgi:hypothetical protein